MRMLGTAASPWQGRAGRTARQHTLISLVGRLLVAQAGAAAAIGLSFSRRNSPSLVLTLVAAIAVYGLAVAVRSGTQAAWLLAISAEASLVAVGLFRFAYARYLGGTLLAILALGTLLRPEVARAFAASPRRRPLAPDQHGPIRPGLPEGAADRRPASSLRF